MGKCLLFVMAGSNIGLFYMGVVSVGECSIFLAIVLCVGELADIRDKLIEGE